MYYLGGVDPNSSSVRTSESPTTFDALGGGGNNDSSDGAIADDDDAPLDNGAIEAVAMGGVEKMKSLHQRPSNSAALTANDGRKHAKPIVAGPKSKG